MEHPDARKNRKLNAIVLTCAIILILLTLITTAVVVLRLGNFVPNEWNVIFLVPKEPSFVMSDGTGVWQTDTEIELFKSEYVGENQKVVVKSSNGEAVFAPGTDIAYTFNLKNNGNMAIDYKVELDFSFLKNNEDFDLEYSPLLVRLYKADHKDYIVGGDDEWIPVDELGVYTDGGTLGVNSYNEYTIEIKWEYESGNDEKDTWLGTITEKETVVFDLDINTLAEQNPDPDAKGGLIGINDGDEVKKIGGDIDLVPFIILITLLFISAAGLAVGIIIKNKNKNPPDGK